MKKLTYLFVAAAALGMVACGGNKPGYVITGTVEGAADGDTVFLQEVVGRQLSKLDTAIIKNGTFTFEGVQDSAVNRYVTSGTGNEAMLMDFFLENGKINILTRLAYGGGDVACNVWQQSVCLGQGNEHLGRNRCPAALDVPEHQSGCCRHDPAVLLQVCVP